MPLARMNSIPGPGTSWTTSAADRKDSRSSHLMHLKRYPTRAGLIRLGLYCLGFMPAAFIATLLDGEAVLRFPYDDRLRLLLRAIPGRRWDPESRVWRVPLDSDRAPALMALLATVPYPLEVSEALTRALSRGAARRPRDELLVDLARPDGNWWFSFATDTAADLAERLLDHPNADRVAAIGRGQLPVDHRAAQMLRACLDSDRRLCLTEDARHALTELSRSPAPRTEATGPSLRSDVELWRDRRGRNWIVIARELAPLARALAMESRLETLDGPAGSVAVAAVQHDAGEVAELLDRLDLGSVDPRVERWLARTTTWRGTIEVGGPRAAPLFLLLGANEPLPTLLRERAPACQGGVTMPLTLDSWRAIDAQTLHGWISPAARRCVAAIEAGQPAPPAVLELSTEHDRPSFVLVPGHDHGMVAEFARVAGAPAITADPYWVPELDRFVSERDPWVAPDALVALQEVREEHARAAGLVALSAATDATLDVPGLGGQLKPFQRAGVQYLLQQRRAFLADEQGLGKTIEALAAIEADGAYPAVVVCPASLKLNWLREIERWLPGRGVRVLMGTGRSSLPLGEITVVNYDILAARLEELRALEPRALVLDESHYCKNAAAKRTQAVQRLAAAVPSAGLVMALPGTPVMNRPPELIAQLRILGRLEDFGSGAQFGRRFRGPDAHLRLHWHLRARCFVRRLKSEVLPQLPAKTRAVGPVELTNEAEYRLAERDVVAWLQSQPLDLRELDAKVAAALRAERLVRCNALKLLAARGKLHAALAWIHDFLTSGERLIVFAGHKEVQRAVLARFPSALHIIGEDSAAARDAALQAFQAGDASESNQLIVCSIEVAGHGLTLTRASSVAFLELDWTPAKHDQAEDRCHRIV